VFVCLFVCLRLVYAPLVPECLWPRAAPLLTRCRLECSWPNEFLESFTANGSEFGFLFSVFRGNLMAHSGHTPPLPQEFKFVLLEREIGFCF